MRSAISHRRSTVGLAIGAIALAGLGITGASASATGLLGITPTGPEPFTSAVNGLADLDTRSTVAPLSSQRSAVPAGATVRWNRYGTPESLSKVGGYLSGSSTGSAQTAARSWLKSHSALFGLSAAQIDALELLQDSTLTGTSAHVVRFRQTFGGLPAATDGMVTVGLDPQKRVAYVSSSLSRVTTSPPAATLGAVDAWLKAAGQLKAAGIDVPTANPGTTGQDHGWTVFSVPGTDQLQRARLGALSLPGAGVRPVWEVNVVDVGGGKAVAYTSYVDAVSGSVLIRRNQVDNLAAMPSMTNTVQPIQGSITPPACGTSDFTVDAATRSVSALVSELNPANDIVLTLKFNGAVIASSDTATSPEVATASLPAGHTGGPVTVQVCPYSDPTVPFTAPGNYVGTFTASEQDTPSTGGNPDPRWKAFTSNPPVSFDPTQTLDTRAVECFFPGTGCGVVLNNLAARGPWDVDQRADAPTFTTLGNAANTAEAWANPLAPGGLMQRPVSPDRFYGDDTKPLQDFTDAWNNSKCDPTTAFTPANNNNDVQAAVTNLFAGHNRMHDFSYFLGFTEQNSNLQDDNFGLTDPSREHDFEVGNVQAGAVSGGNPSFEGRDNANQIALQDGVPGITNQYLFQPIAGAFYSPCADGDFDTSVYGHEYTHAISNRMVGGPSDNLTGFQAGSMGESWSDQVALEYLFENGYSSGGVSPWVEGPYVTNNKVTGIRNYALNHNPLQYGDLGYDVTGPEVHADGEVWSGTMWDARQALVNKYNGSFPESNSSLEKACANGSTTQQPPTAPKPASQCPGGRRWIQLIFDSFLLQDGATSMLDARDAYLAADLMRFGGADQKVLWQAFAGDGMGSNASTVDTDDDQPVSGYVSPVGPEGTLKITATGFTGTSSTPIKGKLYVGDYEARITPIADTDPGTALPATVSMVPGTYDFVFQANGYGLMRFTATVAANQTLSKAIHMSFNSASGTNGARVDGSSTSLNASSLLDDTEATNWAGTNPAGVSVDTPGQNPFVNVDLAGGSQVVRSVNVSAMLRPSATNDNDADSGSRFTALRKFAIETCNDVANTGKCSSTLASGVPGSPYTRIYTSPDDAFAGTAPRPLAPQLLFKKFDVPDTTATHVRLVALENQCSGNAAYAGEQDNDPTNDTDCKAASDRDEIVHAAELEVYSFDSTTRPAGDPVVAEVMTGPATAAPGDQVTYTLTYHNLGPAASSAARITISQLPAGLSFVKASGNVVYDPTARQVVWRLGDVAAGATGKVTLTTKVAGTAHPGDVLLTTAQFSGASTFAPPAAAVTVVSPLTP